MEKKSHIKAFTKKLCLCEKAVVRTLCVTVALLIVSTAFSGFCFASVNNQESAQIKSTTIDFAASAENNATFRELYNTLNSGTGNTIAAAEDIKSSKEAIGDAVENMYSAAVSLSLQKSKMMTDAEITEAVETIPNNTEALPTQKTEPAVSESVPVIEAPTAAPTEVAAAPTKPQTTVAVTAAPTQAATEDKTDSVDSAQNNALTAAASVKTISVKTPPSTLMLDENGVPVSYKKVLRGNASAYSGDGSTATGTVPVPGSIAVNPKIIPYGTKMWIVSADGKYTYGYAVAEDTGGFVNWSNAPIADLFFNSESACNAFGRRDIIIYILN